MPLRIVYVIVLSLVSLFAQNQPQTPKSDFFAQVDAALAKYRAEKCRKNPKECAENCQKDLKQWEDWAAVNVPKHKQLVKDYDSLQQENERLSNRVLWRDIWDSVIALFVAALGVGIGLFLAFRTWKILRQAWPWTPARKQLMVLILGSVWVTGAAVIVVNNSELSRHPVNMLFTGLLYSIPALAFSGTGFWWFAKIAKAEHQKAKAAFE